MDPTNKSHSAAEYSASLALSVAIFLPSGSGLLFLEGRPWVTGLSHWSGGFSEAGACVSVCVCVWMKKSFGFHVSTNVKFKINYDSHRNPIM